MLKKPPTLEQLFTTTLKGERLPPARSRNILKATKDQKGLAHEVWKVYDIGIHLHRVVSCDPRDLPRMQEKIFKDIKYFLFDELRSSFSDLEHAIYEADREKTREAIDNVWRIIE